MLRKEYTPTGKSCKVTFSMSGEESVTSVSVLGDFNDWNPEAGVMKKKKDGAFALTVSIKPGKEYRFRYLVNEVEWMNDPDADFLVSNDYGTQDGVITI